MAKKKTKGVSKFRAAVAGNVSKQKSEGAKYGYFNLPSDFKIFKEEPGSRVTLDILPYIVTDKRHMDRDESTNTAVVGETWYKKPYLVHRGVGANNESYVCPTTIGKKCPICEHRAKLLKEGGDWQDPDIKALRPSKRNLYVVVPLDSKEHEAKPHLWDISQFLFQEKLNEEIGENLDYADFPDLEEGLSLRIRFSEEQFGKNKYAATSRIDFKERDHTYSEKDIKKLPDIDAILNILSYNALEAKFFEYEDDTDDDNFTSIRKSKKMEVEEEVLDLDEDDEDETELADEEVDDEGDEEEEEEELADEGEDDDEEEEDDVSEQDDDEEDEDEDDEDDLDIPEDERCVACSGTGKNSRGGKCKPCDGTGRKKEEPKVKAKKKEEPMKKKEEPKAKKKGKNKCPYGHEFGDDFELHDECDDCEMWDDCIKASEGN